MKRRIAILTIVVTATALLFAGCGPAPASGPTDDLEKLWDVDIGQEGYGRTDASRLVDRQGKGIRLTFDIAPAALRQTPPADMTPDMKIVRAGGRVYWIGESAVCWDGIDEDGNPIGGTQYARRMLWKQGSRIYQVFAETNKQKIFSLTSQRDASLDIVSSETAMLLERHPLAGLAGFDIQADIRWVEFKNNRITVSVTLYTAGYNESVILDMTRNGGFELKKEAGMEYYARGGGKSPDSPFVSLMLFRTDIGVFYLNAGVAWAYRDDVSEDALDFIKPELAKSIAEQMGCNIIPFEDLPGTPEA
jgi:hypothetical protein